MTLHYRQITGDMIETYKIISGKYDSTIAPTLLMSFVRSFFCSLRAGSSLLWTPALRPFESVQCASPGIGRELIGVCVCVWCERYVG